jgi:hypothetical protein
MTWPFLRCSMATTWAVLLPWRGAVTLRERRHQIRHAVVRQAEHTRYGII